MSPRRPPDDREAKEGASDVILIAPPEDRDPPDDPPGQKSADPKEDPKSSKSPKKARPSRRVRIAQDLEALDQRQGAGPALDDEAPMNAPRPAKPGTATKPQSTRVTKPKVQNRANLKATCLGRYKVDEGILRWYWRIDRCPAAHSGIAKRETAKCLYATVEEVQAELAAMVDRGDHRASVEHGDSHYKITDLLAMEIEASRAEWSSRTVERIEYLYQDVSRYLGDARVNSRSGEVIEAMFQRMREEGRAHKAASFARLYLGRAWRNQLQAGKISQPRPPMRLNWTAPRTVIRYTPPRKHIEQVINNLKGEAQLVLRVLAVTGARVGEIGSMRRCDYDPVLKELHVDGKTGPRIIPADKSIQGVLAARADGSHEPLFNCHRPPDTKNWVNTRLKAACRRLEIPRFSAHALRRAAVDYFYETESDIASVAKMFGHNIEIALKHYRKPSNESLRRAMDRSAIGDFSGITALRRTMLVALPELMLDDGIQSDPKAREAVRVLVAHLSQSCLGAPPHEQPPVTSAIAPAPLAHSASAARDANSGPVPRPPRRATITSTKEGAAPAPTAAPSEEASPPASTGATPSKGATDKTSRRAATRSAKATPAALDEPKAAGEAPDATPSGRRSVTARSLGDRPTPRRVATS